MLKIPLIILLIVTVIGLFIPKKYVPKQRKFTKTSRRQLRKAARRARERDEPYGLPWMGGTTHRKKTKYYWDD